MKRVQITCPARIAISVALRRPHRSVIAARNTRPPSIGKQGSRLKSARIRLIWPVILKARPSHARLLLPVWDAMAMVCPPMVSPTAASVRLTAGPARATAISCRGLRGIDSRRATPPIRVRTMSRTRCPKRIAMKEWPSSWRPMLTKTRSEMISVKIATGRPSPRLLRK